MVCESCGETPKLGGAKGFPSAVVQINNPEKLILFRKVVIPASLGDDETNPPVVGKFYNVLAVYEANKHAYLYSSDGIPTELTTDVAEELEEKINKVANDLADEEVTRKNADDSLSNRIDQTNTDLGAEVTARTEAVNTVAGNLATETSQRVSTDNTLQGSINAEVTARTNADTALGNRITTEISDRQSADAVLQQAIDTEVSNRTTNDTALSNAIAAETAARITADTNLQNQINTASGGVTAEATARENADTALGLRIDGVSGDVAAETTARENADTALGLRIDDVSATAATAVQPTAIDKTYVGNVTLATPTTTTVNLNVAKSNILSGATSSSTVNMPVASSTQAGVINSSTYDAIQNNSNNINALLNGAVAITGLPASPSQSDITTAWQTETGLTALVNRASVYDVTNNKVWTYFTNDTTWHAASNTSQVTVNTFTNSSEGVIKGSTNSGQVYAESDGTGSVNGWDTLSATVGDHTTKLATIANGAEVNVQSDWNQTNTSADDYIKNKPTIPTVNNATLTIQKNGTNVQTFTANSSSNKTANIVVPTKTSDLTNDGDGTNAFATVNNIPAAQVNSDWDAASGVAQILNKPTIPTVNNATLTIQKNGTNVQTFTANSSTNKTANITVPTKTSDLNNDSGFITNAVNDLANYTLTSSLGAVALSNSYTDLNNQPTIPTVNNATLTIQKNGTSIGTFTANASSNKTVNVTVPTAVSELSNDAGYTSNAGTITKVQANGTDVASSGTANIPAASTSAYGVTKLSNATNSTSTALAATANAVKTAYDLAASKGTGTITKVQANGTDVASSGTANIPAASTAVYGVTKLSTATNSTSTALAATASAVKAAYDLANGRVSDVQVNGTSVTTSGVANVPTATTSAYGATKLSSSTSSTSEVLAATPKAVKTAYDLANGRVSDVQVNGTSVTTSGVANIPVATTSAYGAAKLSTSTSSTSTALAATASAVKSAYDLAATKAKITVQSTDPGEGATLAAGEFIVVY